MSDRVGKAEEREKSQSKLKIFSQDSGENDKKSGPERALPTDSNDLKTRLVLRAPGSLAPRDSHWAHFRPL